MMPFLTMTKTGLRYQMTSAIVGQGFLLYNAVCDALKKEYPKSTGDELFRYARLVISAVIAKIHTISEN
ncbi:conserved hypothetical protein [Ricinus communis]|uniref:Uncharacterized protein n=1 Tax=Ricinus communis TaxID=3988 RepID=B9RUD6_RICCO|nr:conserved hypothetical protein [Ricinus communis]